MSFITLIVVVLVVSKLELNKSLILSLIFDVFLELQGINWGWIMEEKRWVDAEVKGYSIETGNDFVIPLTELKLLNILLIQ